MAWPLSQDYNEAIQSPQLSFSDPELRGGAAVTNALGLPMPRSGNFADVYEFVGTGGQKWAVKCFTREVPGLQERYSEISKHLLRAKLPFMVDFQYLEQGLRVRGHWYPALKMHWVEGFLLNEFVRGNVDKPTLLEALSRVWLRMARKLREAGIAHADLQHGNVLLVPGNKASSLSVKLIDYDGMFVPALQQRGSGEVGHPAYQHPQRLQQGTHNAEVDRLPLLAIACALRALRVGGRGLWERYDNGDNLLFRESDLRQPGQSPLFKELWNLPDGAAHDLAGFLTLGLLGPLHEVPVLSEIMREDGVKPMTADQESQVSAALGAGFKVTRSAVVAAVLPAVQPVAPPGGSERRAVPGESVDPWGSLTEEEVSSEQELLKGRQRKLRFSGIGIVLSVSLMVGLGGVVLATRYFGSTETVKPNQEEKYSVPQAKKGQIQVSPVEGTITIETDNQDLAVLVKQAGKLIAIIDGKTGHRATLRTGEYELELGAGATGMTLKPDRLTLTREGKIVEVWRQKKNQEQPAGELRRFEGHEGRVVSLSFSEDGRWLVSGGGGRAEKGKLLPGSDFTVRLWNASSGKLEMVFEKHESYVWGVAFLPQRKAIISGGQGICAWDLITGIELDLGPELATRACRHLFVMGHTNRLLISRKPDLHVLDMNTKQEVGKLTGHTAQVNTASITPDGRFLLTGGDDRTVRSWDLDKKQMIGVLKGHSEEVLAVAVSPDGTFGVSSSKDNTVRVWDLVSRREKFRLGHSATVSALAVSPDGKYVLTGAGRRYAGGKWSNDSDDTLRLWDAARGSELYRFVAAGQGTCFALVFSPDGTTFE